MEYAQGRVPGWRVPAAVPQGIDTQLHLHDVLLDIELDIVSQVCRQSGNRDNLWGGRVLKQKAVVKMQGPEDKLLAQRRVQDTDDLRTLGDETVVSVVEMAC